MMLDEGYSINLDVVDLGSELHSLVLLASDDGPDVRTVYADDAFLHLLFLSKQALQSTPQFGGGRPAVFAMLGISESGVVNVTILVARLPFLQRLTGL